MEYEAFYTTVAQVIPVLLLGLVIDFHAWRPFTGPLNNRWVRMIVNTPDKVRVNLGIFVTVFVLSGLSEFLCLVALALERDLGVVMRLIIAIAACTLAGFLVGEAVLRALLPNADRGNH